MPAITSRANPRVKDIRALKNRRERERTGLFLAEGVRVVREGLRASAAIETLLVVEERVSAEERKLVDAARSAGAEVVEVSAAVYDSLSFRGDPDSVAAVVRQRRDILPDSAANDLSWTAVDGIQHPGNLGTLIRTSDAAGGAGIVLTGQSTDPYHPVAVRGSLGAIFSQRVVTTTLEELEQWLKRMGSFVTGTSPSARVDYRAARYRRPVVVLCGNERVGLSERQASMCDVLVRIPMAGVVDSLNLAVATALVLYEIYRQNER